MPWQHPTPIAVVGPTASGKSALAITLAKTLGGEIVNVDSMQCYRGMDIGTAKLAPGEREGIAHHLLDIWPVTMDASVADYQQRARATIEALMARNVCPIIVGGSMLYIQSLVDNWQFPPTDQQLRQQYYDLVDEIGIGAVHGLLASRDPAAAAIIESNDVRRTVRALEVIDLTGKPFSASKPPIGAPAEYGTVQLGLHTTNEWLHPRIVARTEQMFANGFVEEVRSLQQEAGLVRHSTAGRAIGYAQVMDMLAGQLSYEEAVERTIIATRQYVRRQRSWFHKDPRICWLDAAGNPGDQAVGLLQSGT
ncbi:tRNA (adenosine(37)-N6)-dimethylallyltransferase MiaA [Corynebacterium choanae]|uniref:tRNA (adenosine(37)-N6)-dimethylallyltransferase MiaA n=1 Tax=Corynebacterium choanae TaxID=1862358 RepID=UPI000F4D5753|nr:tRNA (adenosine(37)-N6)-dimethylallyltransferase MiaA [Corynebacterium choanae]